MIGDGPAAVKVWVFLFFLTHIDQIMTHNDQIMTHYDQIMTHYDQIIVKFTL